MALITISEVARRSGVAASALRYYEERGLITSERTGAGHRRFPREVLRRIAFIVYAQRIGLTLEEISEELAKLPEDRKATARDWRQLMAKWQARIRERMEELQRLEDSLLNCIGCGCLSLERCRLSNPEDRVRKQGPGPRFWVVEREKGRPRGAAPTQGRSES